jgi:hypothetical protein
MEKRKMPDDKTPYWFRESIAYAYPEAGGRGRAVQGPPDDIHVQRLAIARRMITFCGEPLRCREAACRRSKRCVGPTMRCQRDRPAPAMTAAEQTNMMLDIRELLKKRLIEMGKEVG